VVSRFSLERQVSARRLLGEPTYRGGAQRTRDEEVRDDFGSRSARGGGRHVRRDPTGTPPADTPWYHSSRRVGPAGYEFVYPKDQATRIARTTNQGVLMTDTPLISVEAMKRAQVYFLGPSDTTAEPRGKAPAHAPPTGSTASAREIKIAQQRSSVGPREPSEGASSLPFVGLSGLMLLAAVLIALRHHSLKTVARPSLSVRERWVERESPTNDF